MVYILKYKSAASLPYHWYVTIDSDAGRNLVYNASTSDPYHSTIFSPVYIFLDGKIDLVFNVFFWFRIHRIL